MFSKKIFVIVILTTNGSQIHDYIFDQTWSNNYKYIFTQNKNPDPSPYKYDYFNKWIIDRIIQSTDKITSFEVKYIIVKQKIMNNDMTIDIFTRDLNKNGPYTILHQLDCYIGALYDDINMACYKLYIKK